jgi:hypothetical protein
MSNWPKYESHKVVQALPICRVDKRDDGAIFITVRHEDDTKEMFEPTVPGMAGKAEVGGYAMLYPDGFKSISPQKQFEEGYTRV